jgi:hypothetical protein
VRGDDPSAFGHGVSPATEAPLTVDGGACVVDEPVLATFFDELPLLKTPATLAIRATTARMTTVTMTVRRRDCLRRAACIACCCAWRPAFCRCLLSFGIG